MISRIFIFRCLHSCIHFSCLLSSSSNKGWPQLPHGTHYLDVCDEPCSILLLQRHKASPKVLWRQESEEWARLKWYEAYNQTLRQLHESHQCNHGPLWCPHDCWWLTGLLLYTCFWSLGSHQGHCHFPIPERRCRQNTTYLVTHPKCTYHFIHLQPGRQRIPIPLGICSLGSYRPKEGQRHCSYCFSPGKTYCQGW